MATHVRVLAVFHFVIGGLGVLLAWALYLGVSFLPRPAGYIHEGSDVPLAVIELIAWIVLAIVLSLSVPCLLLGYGLWNFRPWGRILGLVLCALNLLNFPFGTVIALYGFWVLLKPESEALFRAQPAGAP
jgi:hypothetical protein